MIIIEHQLGKDITAIYDSERKTIPHNYTSPSKALLGLAKNYPEELIIWCETAITTQVDFEAFKENFKHKRMMQSCNAQRYLPDAIGYVEKTPFIKVNPKVTYPTWQMSPLFGGAYGKVILKVAAVVDNRKSFGYLLNSIGKVARLHGVFCYSLPNLIQGKVKTSSSKASITELFTFVHQHYRTRWCLILLSCLWLFEKRFPFIPFLVGFFSRKINRVFVDFTSISNHIETVEPIESMDVIIPTIGRPTYLYDFLRDLANQTWLPKSVIIVEQNPDKSSQSQLSYLEDETWPFAINHQFIHRSGACNARNLALAEVTSDWVFLADDDIRIYDMLLEDVVERHRKIGGQVLNIPCLVNGQEESSVIEKQWEAFGSGCSFIKASLLDHVAFDDGFEHGYGEDIDFGMQLRNIGEDITYLPTLQITHLKAPVGGFRKAVKKNWDDSRPLPKPSPTIMLYHLKHSTPRQRLGYRLVYTLKQLDFRRFYTFTSQLRLIDKQWAQSEFWAQKLQNQY